MINQYSKIHHLMQHIEGVAFETDIDGNFIFLNDKWEFYTNFTVKECIGKNINDVFKLNSTNYKLSFDKAIAAKKDKIDFTFKYSCNNKLKWLQLKANFVNKDDGFNSFIGIITDVTEFKETQLELEKASALKDDFLLTMFHEIRTPLNDFTTLANQLLIDDGNNPERLKNLKSLKYSSEHLLGILNDLIDFKKVESGNVKIINKDFNLVHLLENIKSHFSLRAEKKGVVFNILQHQDIPKNIIGDDLKLTQVITNLLNNSLTYKNKGSIVLKIKSLGVERNKATLEFSIQDKGSNDYKQNRLAITENFLENNSYSYIKDGSKGLSLSITKRLLQLQDSDLVICNEESKGLSFSFKMVYELSNKLYSFKRNMIKMQSSFDPLDINVLVAEDNKMNITSLKPFFSKWGVNFKVVENGQELLKYFKMDSFNFDLVLMDLEMPIMDGYKATRTIRNLNDETKSSIPIVAFTSLSQTDIKVKTQRYGMNGFLSKPFNPIKLYKVLNTYAKSNIQRDVV